jgi:hypothetical protein
LLPKTDTATGLLPIGRYAGELHEIRAAFVDDPAFTQSTSRLEIWEHFESATEELRKILSVAYVWIGGSFTTDKLDPDDIDVVYWAEDTKLEAVIDPKDQAVLNLFVMNQLRAQTGLRLDTRVCHWHVQPKAALQNTLEHLRYVQLRGFWDDFWLRKLSGPKGALPVRPDALPKRGYFEVKLDGLDDV